MPSIWLNAPKSNPYSGVLLDSPEDLLRLEAHVQAVQPAMLVVDTTGNATDRDVCRPEEAKAFFQPLQVLARTYRLAVLCLTHLNAKGGVLGRRALEKARVVLRLLRPDPQAEPNRRQLEVIKSNSKVPAPLGVTMGDEGNDYDCECPGESAATNGAGAVQEATKVAGCMVWLQQRLAGGPVLLKQLSKEAKVASYSRKTMYNAKEQLALVDSMSEPAGKLWCLPATEQEAEEEPDLDAPEAS
jgi:hypothetical protein